MITFSDDTPVWIKDWVLYSHSLLIPEWELEVEMKDCVDEEIPECTGDVDISHGYLRASLCFQRDIKETQLNIVRVVVHEVCHIFLSQMSSTAETLISSKTVRETGWKKFEHVEEETVVRLSRIIVQLRDKEK
jgi:hypothetical protein